MKHVLKERELHLAALLRRQPSTGAALYFAIKNKRLFLKALNPLLRSLRPRPTRGSLRLKSRCYAASRAIPHTRLAPPLNPLLILVCKTLRNNQTRLT